MSKILFYFNGTDGYQSPFENGLSFPKDIVRVYFKGASGRNTGGGRILPNLADVAERIVNTFNNDEIDLEKLKKDFGEDIIIKPYYTSQHGKKIKGIKEIVLTGYSRGAISAFYTAKELHQRHNKLPVRIIANQPVSGNFYDGANTTVAGILDLQHCDNIKSVDIVVGRYVKQLGLSGVNVVKTIIHNFFFTQAVPFFSSKTDARIIESPIQSHFSTLGNSLAYAHMINALRKYIPEIGDVAINIKKQIYKQSYSDYEPIFLHDEHEKQVIFGNAKSIKLDPLYQEALDELTREALESASIKIADVKVLSNEQKKAIYSVYRRMKITGETALMMMQIINKTPAGEKLTQIINKSTQMIAKCLHYLSSKEESNLKRSHIIKERNRYLRNLFKLSFDFLICGSPSSEAKKNFIQELNENDRILINEIICRRNNPILDACVTVIKNLVFGICSLGGVFIYNAATNKNIFFRKNVETEVQLVDRTNEIRQLFN